MNKKTYLIAAMCMMALSGCTQKSELPENPKDKEEYQDSQGNHWIYNAMLMRWALMPSIANGTVDHPLLLPGDKHLAQCPGRDGRPAVKHQSRHAVVIENKRFGVRKHRPHT